MSRNNIIITEKQQHNMESEKKRYHNDLESQQGEDIPPVRPSFLIFWLVFVLGTMGIIVYSNWTTPEAAIHATSLPKHMTSATPPLKLPHISAPTSVCSSLDLRQEWQALSDEEQTIYQSSVKCLVELPSQIGGGSRYGDFLQTYASFGWQSNRISSYLPWNRWFLHTFETALRSECGYTGYMPYSDWSQTVAGATSSRTSSQAALHRGDEAERDEVSAASITEMLSAESYQEFVKDLAGKARGLTTIEIPLLDLLQDPLFQHQAQVDRLWWLWQQEHSSETPSMDEVIGLGDLAQAINVTEITKTESDHLCYRYV